MKNGAALRIHSANTNATTVTDYGAFLDVGGNLTLTETSILYPISNPTNGGSLFMRAGNVYVGADAAISADYGGFAGNYGTGKGNVSFGPRGSGAGYGGIGGISVTDAAGGQTYGSSNAPVHCGSGGGIYNSLHPGGRGGGLVWIESPGSITIQGTVSANGEPIISADGGGSGGGIYLFCRNDFSGNGDLWALGGNGHISFSGGGGGGRIAIHRRISGHKFTGSLTLANVAGGSGYDSGAEGTIYWETLPDRGTLFLIR